MEKHISVNGIPTLKFNDNTYINFGSGNDIKYVVVAFKGRDGHMERTIVDVSLSSLPSNFSTIFGKKNLTNLRKEIKPYVTSKHTVSKNNIIKAIDNFLKKYV